MRYVIKSLVHKYYKREGVKGNYKYYYTKEEYDKAKGGSESANQSAPATPITPETHKENIISDFRNQFSKKGIPLAQINASIALMEVRSDSWASETGNKAEKWYEQISGIKQGEFETKDLKYQIIGENANINKDIRLNLDIARQMESEGKDSENIFLATGWERGSDKKWRYEILDLKGYMGVNKLKFATSVESQKEIDKLNKEGDFSSDRSKLINTINELKKEIGLIRPNQDDNIKFTTSLRQNDSRLLPEQPISYNIEKYSQIRDGFANLRDIVTADDLFDAYPKLKEIKVKVGKLIEGSYAQLNTRSDIITISEKLNESELKSALTHEIQHAIQEIEGFAKGGSPAQFKNWDIDKLKSDNESQANLLKQLIVKEQEKGNDVSEVLKTGEGKILSENLSKLQRAIYEYENAHKLYRKLAGEVESRNVQTRLNLSPEQRKQTPISKTEDVSRNDQIKYFGSDVSEYRPKGAVETLRNGKLIIHALSQPDFSTMVHEIAHVFEKDLSEIEKNTIEKHGGSEVFAKGFEQYLLKGKAPIKELKHIFAKCKSFMFGIYNKLNRTQVPIHPELTKIFNRLMTIKKSISKKIKYIIKSVF